MSIPYHSNIEKLTLKNTYYRNVIYTVPGSMQLVLMSIPPGEIIPMETHKKSTQFFRVESGLGVAIVKGKHIGLSDGVGLIIPPNTLHEIEAIGDKPLKLYTLYTHPEHPQGMIEKKRPFFT